jgi:hypothetical protein
MHFIRMKHKERFLKDSSHLFGAAYDCVNSGWDRRRISNGRERPRHISGGYSPASHRGRPGSNPGLIIWDFVMDKRGAGAGFLRELRFPLPIYIPSASPQSSSQSPEAGTIGLE